MSAPAQRWRQRRQKIVHHSTFSREGDRASPPEKNLERIRNPLQNTKVTLKA